MTYFITWTRDNFRFVEQYNAPTMRAALEQFEEEFHLDQLTIVSVKRVTK